MTLMTDLYKLAQKRLEPLIASVKPQLHRKLTDTFALADDVARGEARKRRPSTSSTSSRRGSTASRRMSFLKGGEPPAPSAPSPVLMSQALLLKSVKQRRGKNEPENELLMRVTHLHCGNKAIANIDGLEYARKVQVLYLNDNYIPRIENLSWVKASLTHLYLQNNQIHEMDGLSELCNLTKLYLDKNRIQCIRGLDGCTRLEELHVSDQALPAGVNLEFCPQSMSVIGKSLRVLHAAGCNVADVNALGHLQRLDSLDLSGSSIESVACVNFLTSYCPFMTNLNLEGAPVTRLRKNCEEILAHAEYLEQFNGKEVTAKERDFLKRFAQRKAQRNAGRRCSNSAGQQRTAGLDPVIEHAPVLHDSRGRRGSTYW
jgi:hypothetical protein